ncbi:MAG: hypothetical protein A2V79_11885 [Betaproteobacteria bacterium RBG_16_56_24]|nr:MAG: hypothetical protein A2V79_11885 [Betaproteobacteria bacterium RBG_16_56_24]
MAQTLEWNKEALLQSPLFTPLHPILAKLGTNGFPTLQDCNALLAARQPTILVQSGIPLRFMAQQRGKLPFEAQYEPRCYLSGEVPTRAHNWHDLLNALVWLTFPKAKAAFNARHYHALMDANACTKSVRPEVSKGGEPLRHAQDRLRYLSPNGTASCSERGAVRDVNTLLDESGVIVAYSDAELAGLLRDFQWRELFWQRREQVRACHFDITFSPERSRRVRTGMGFYLFGHGLYEKALHPYVGMTGQGLLLAVEQAFFSWPLAQRLAHLDTLLADYLAAPEHCRSTRDLTPVPVLGVPGWTVDNDSATYYDNTAYFRPGRRG